MSILKKTINAFKVSNRIPNEVEDFLVLEALSIMHCPYCGQAYTFGKLLGNEIIFMHKETMKCKQNYMTYKLNRVDP
jgi:hypothetical protein